MTEFQYQVLVIIVFDPDRVGLRQAILRIHRVMIVITGFASVFLDVIHISCVEWVVNDTTTRLALSVPSGKTLETSVTLSW